MEDLWLKAVLEPIVAHWNKPLKIIGRRRSQESVKTVFGDVVWRVHLSLQDC